MRIDDNAVPGEITLKELVTLSDTTGKIVSEREKSWKHIYEAAKMNMDLKLQKHS
jgi:hypothetical protein